MYYKNHQPSIVAMKNMCSYEIGEDEEYCGVPVGFQDRPSASNDDLYETLPGNVDNSKDNSKAKASKRSNFFTFPKLFGRASENQEESSAKRLENMQIRCQNNDFQWQECVLKLEPYENNKKVKLSAFNLGFREGDEPFLTIDLDKFKLQTPSPTFSNRVNLQQINDGTLVSFQVLFQINFKKYEKIKQR